MSLAGRAALLLALAAAAYVIFAAFAARRRPGPDWRLSAERAVHAVFAFTTVAVGVLWFALLTDRFELRNVAEYSSASLAWQFKLTAMWGSQAGSLLLWAWILAGFSSLVVVLNRGRHRELMPVAMAVLMGVAVFFLILMSFVTSPFEVLPVAPAEGRGLNPLLQNFYMQIHPPILYVGYVGLSVPFAFAIAALVTRRLDGAWLASTRRWTVTAWLFLGAGILLGAKWAYETLGWGGYWAWDPVENAALMPWLVATAFLHSVMVQERRGMLKVWNISLVILAFSLCLFGTFLTRSGILSSVHAFGESTLGPFFLAFILAILAGSAALLITRLPLLRSRHSLESYLSREAIFLFNNLLLVGLAVAVFWGTMFPVLSEALRGRQITVGQGFYEGIAVPLGLALLVLTGLGPLVPWRKASPRQVARRVAVPLGVAGATLAVLAVVGDPAGHPVATAAVTGCAFTAACIGGEFVRGARARRALVGGRRIAALGGAVMANRRRYGGYMVHVAVVVMLIGIVGSKGFVGEADISLREGERVEAEGYAFVHRGTTRSTDAHRTRTTVELDVFRGDRRVATMHPASDVFAVDGTGASAVAIDGSPTRDLYLYLAGIDPAERAHITVYVNPLVAWIWAGGILMVLGGLLAAWPARTERALAPSAARETAAEGRRAW